MPNENEPLVPLLGLPDKNGFVEWCGERYEVPETLLLHEWAWMGVVDALDGCRVEPDGYCEHGTPSWLVAVAFL